MKRINIFVHDEQLNYLKALPNMSDFIREAIGLLILEKSKYTVDEKLAVINGRLDTIERRLDCQEKILKKWEGD